MYNSVIFAILICFIFTAIACATAPEATVPERASVTGLSTDLPVTRSCLGHGSPSPRPLDPAAHVYDTAVRVYLHKNASSIGRETDGDEEQKALAVTDDFIYRLCITGPENCLREQFSQAKNKSDKLSLIKTKGAYAYDRALHCLNREGEAYHGAGRPELYNERIAIHLAGSAKPVGMLRETDYYGETDTKTIDDEEATWQRCYKSISEGISQSEGIASWVDDGLIATVDCGAETSEERDLAPVDIQNPSQADR